MPSRIRKEIWGDLGLYEAQMTFESDTLSIASDAIEGTATEKGGSVSDEIVYGAPFTSGPGSVMSRVEIGGASALRQIQRHDIRLFLRALDDRVAAVG